MVIYDIVKFVTYIFLLMKNKKINQNYQLMILDYLSYCLIPKEL